MSCDGIVPVGFSEDYISPGISEDILGCGFKLNIKPGESAHTRQVFQNEKKQKHNQSETFGFCEIMDDLDKVKKHLEINGSLKISYGPLISGEGAGRYLQESLQTKRQASLRYRARHVHSFSDLKIDSQLGLLRLVEDLKEELDRGTIDQDKYGTKYVHQVIWGAQLDISFNLTSEEEEDLQEIMAELKGSIGIGLLSVDFKAKFDMKNSSGRSKYSMHMKAKASGVHIQVPPNPSLDDVCKIIKDFNEKYEALSGREEQTKQQRIEHTHLSPIAFQLRDIKDQLTGPNSLELALLDQRMQVTADVFLVASEWMARLQVVKVELVRKYDSPLERDTVLDSWTTQVTQQMAELCAKQQECCDYRGLPLAELLGERGLSGLPAMYPEPLSDSLALLNGLVGNGSIKSPTVPTGINAYDYEGFAILGTGTELIPCLSGRLVHNGEVVASGRTPTDLALMVHIKNHKLNPELLKTKIMSGEEVDPTKGDLFIPDDLKELLEEKSETSGNWLGPIFSGKRLVLTGSQGAGKTSFFNRVTGAMCLGSDRLTACTKDLSIMRAQGPAKELTVVDCPGINNADGMPIDEAMEMRKGLIKGDVASIVVFSALPNVAKHSILEQDLLFMEQIMSCGTFKTDASGALMPEGSPDRTRPFLVLTRRDNTAIPREKFQAAIDHVRDRFPWIGPVAIIDPGVSLQWIYDTIIAFAGYQVRCVTNHSIPLYEMFTKFKLKFQKPKEEWAQYIQEAESDMENGKEAAIVEINKVIRARGPGSLGGHEVEMVPPTLDAVLRFIDDLWEVKVDETLAKCFKTTREELWLDIDDSDTMNEKVNIRNYLKHALAPAQAAVRKKVLQHYPDSGVAAVYKACHHCGAVYVKPAGCNYLGRCGGTTIAEDSSHPTTLMKRLEYRYDSGENLLEIHNQSPGELETQAWTLRRMLNTASSWLPINSRSEADNTTRQVDGEWGSLYTGCGRELTWDKMNAITCPKMLEVGILVEVAEVMCVPVAACGTMPIEQFLSGLGNGYKDYIQAFKDHDVKVVSDVCAADLSSTELDDWLQTIIRINSIVHRRNIQKALKAF